MTQPTPTRTNSGALMPALLFFGGITLIMVAAFVTRPSQHTYADMELTASAVVVAVNQNSTAVAQQVALAATATQQALQPTATPTPEEIAQVALDPAMVSAG